MLKKLKPQFSQVYSKTDNQEFLKKYDWNFIKKRLLRLVIPTVSWSYIIWYFSRYDFVGIKEFIFFPTSIKEYTKSLLTTPDYVI